MTAPSTTQGPVLHRRFAFQETVRILALLGVAAWLLHPFATSRQVGAGDALWYANMLADFCLQLRAGIFPVFVGQTEFAFNGAVYPLRVAPLYQHLGGLLDFATGHRLGWFTLQHVCVIVCGVAGILSSYFTLNALAPNRRWTAAGLAVLYLSCPGVLGTVYTQDLYMTWMTVPFLPLAIFGIVRTFRHDDRTSQVWLAAPLAALWLAHSPVALWMTLIAAGTQFARLIFVPRRWESVRRALIGATVFLGLGVYPFISVAALQTPGVSFAVTAGLEQQERITNTLREVFPAVLLPLSDHARALSDLQLGYGLWLVGAFALVGSVRARRLEITLLLTACGTLLLLLLPVPGVTDWLWNHLPDQIKRITFYWPMHRFYLLLAAMLVAAVQLSAAETENSRLKNPLCAILIGCITFAIIWSLWESRQFIRAGHERTATREVSDRVQRPENLLLMNHAYGLFAALPPTFSNGVMDPRSETHFLRRDNFEPLVVVDSTPALAEGSFSGELDANPGIVNLAPKFHLEPGRRYTLVFAWGDHDYSGVVQVVGRKLFREYRLPKSGEPRAFGVEPPANAALPLWTTDPGGDDVLVRFIPTASGAKAEDYKRFGKYSFREISTAAAPIAVTSLVPFRANVQAPEKSWLETPRMFQPGYEARVDGVSVEARRSDAGLTLIGLNAGRHDVNLSFVGPLALRLAYWFSLSIWAALLLTIGRCALLRFKN